MGKICLMVVALSLFSLMIMGNVCASTNIALLGTAGNDGWFGGVPDTTAALNDGSTANNWGVPGMLHLDYGEPSRAYITWDDVVAVEQVKVFHVGPGYITRAFQIQTLVLGGSATNDADWITQTSVVDNSDLVTTHNLPLVFTQGVRIFITDSNLVDTAGRIAEMEVYGSVRANIAMLGTAGNDGWFGGVPDTTAALNDGSTANNWGVPGMLHLDYGEPSRAYITWDDVVAVEQVKVFHVGPGYITRAFQIQTLVLGGSATNDADWITQTSVVDNSDLVTTHNLPLVFTQGVRIFITDSNLVDTAGRIAEMEVQGYISSVFSFMMAKVKGLEAELVAANIEIADLQNQLANTNITLSGTTYYLALQGQLALAQAAADGLATQISNLQSTIAAKDATIADLNSQLTAAYTTIASLNTQIAGLQDKITEGLSGLAEIQSLIGTPQGRRSSDWVSSGSDIGNLAEAVIDMLLAPPGQNIRTQGWK